MRASELAGLAPVGRERAVRVRLGKRRSQVAGPGITLPVTALPGMALPGSGQGQVLAGLMRPALGQRRARMSMRWPDRAWLARGRPARE